MSRLSFSYFKYLKHMLEGKHSTKILVTPVPVIMYQLIYWYCYKSNMPSIYSTRYYYLYFNNVLGWP